MERIRILPDQVANQIAAGEVIERPAAVVRELVENSLDAGARRIQVEFRHGGKSFIRVEDDGCGLSPDEALLALERHATSKLRSADDLLSIGTMGFRGEALPSIASVSRFQLQSRDRSYPSGTEILISGGTMVRQRECGMAGGTRIEVSHLFNSVPERRTFLKADKTEAAHIIQLCRLYALAHPDVHFVLIEDEREVFQSPQCANLQDRVSEIWGRRLAGDLETMPQAETEGMKLRGLIGRPGSGRSTRAEMIAMLNGRPVDSRAVSMAITEAYHGQMPKGRYPMAFLFLEVDPSAVDVNVHPAKREVRFREEPKVRQFVLRSLLERLRELSQEFAPKVEELQKPTHEPVRPQQSAPKLDRPILRQPAKSLYSADTLHSAQEAKSYFDVPAPVAIQERPPVQKPAQTSWQYLAPLERNIALFKAPDGLVALHLRAAHERVLYEKVKRSDASMSQPLLLPASLELDPVSSGALEGALEFLRDGGFEIERFGRNFFRVHAAPQWLAPERVEGFLHDLSLQLREGAEKPELMREELARLAAAKALTVSDAPGQAAAEALAAELLACEQPATCPQGKPTYFEISRAEMQRRFGRS